MENQTFEINDCGVVINPIIVWHFMPKNALAWCYWQIRVGKCENGLWDFGYSRASGGSPVCIGQYQTKEDAIECGIFSMMGYFNKGYQTNMITEKLFREGQNAFKMFTNSRLQKKENPRIKALEMLSVVDTGTNYTQGSLF